MKRLYLQRRKSYDKKKNVCRAVLPSSRTVSKENNGDNNLGRQYCVPASELLVEARHAGENMLLLWDDNQ